jgi:hypothetical protein
MKARFCTVGEHKCCPCKKDEPLKSYRDSFDPAWVDLKKTILDSLGGSNSPQTTPNPAGTNIVRPFSPFAPPEEKKKREKTLVNQKLY